MCTPRDTAAAAVEVAAQLTGLKQLYLDVPGLADVTVLLQLTALTGLQKLDLAVAANELYLGIQSKVCRLTVQNVCEGWCVFVESMFGLDSSGQWTVVMQQYTLVRS
jgi:hypothetical protein